ncbi:MAG: acyl carrier protein [Desulfobulbaceae bacterium]|nr:acyl carrier protein [Desulfobulbaceae bacterium]
MGTHAEFIRTFIFENFLFDADESALNNDDSFLEKGIIDSTGILELVEWLEDEFGIPIEDEELIPENLDSVNLLAAFIHRKKADAYT